jgi:hypothetical protein
MTLYDTDFATWAQTQATALRAKDWPTLEVDHLAEEIEALPKREEIIVVSHLTVLLQHLLKWAYQPTHRSQSWRKSIRVPRQRIARILRRYNYLQARLPEFIAEAYVDARENAADETGRDLHRFPDVCPWDVADVLDKEYWPEIMP